MGWPYQQKPPMGWPLDYDSGLVPEAGFWPMLEGSGNTVQDLSGNGNHGTFQGNASWDAGFVVCESNGDKITSPTIGFGQAGTFIFCFNGTGTPASYGSFISADVQSNFCILRGNSETLIYVETNSSNVSLTGKDLWGTGKHIVAITWDASINTRKRYDDGVLADTDTTAFTAPTYGSNFHFGDRADGLRTVGGRFEWIDGYNRALSASEIALFYRPFCMFKDPAEIALLGGYQAVGGTILPQITSAYMRI